MKRIISPKTPSQIDKNKIAQDISLEQARSLKRVVGRIIEVDPLGRNELACTVRVRDKSGGHVYGGGIVLTIIDDPLDILQRFGAIQTGMRVEVFYTGTIESPQAYARIIGPAVDKEGIAPESNEILAAPTLPFEPLGF